jgi:hypothetical protein
MAQTTTTSTGPGGTTRSTTTTPDPKPGKAWVANTGKDKAKNPWVKPKAPKGDVAWDDEKGWVTAASQATAYDIPLAIITSDKGKGGLEELFNKAWAAQKEGKEWTKEAFITELQATNWYKTRSEAQRKYYTLSKDPAQAVEFQKQITSNVEVIKDAAGKLGASLTDAQAIELAKANLQNGYNPSELNNLLAQYISFSGKTDEEKIGSLFGIAGSNEDELRRWARENNVTLSEDWILKEVRTIASGKYDVDKSKNYINDIARQQYPGWADKLDGVRSLKDLSLGYRNVIGKELGIEDIDKIDFTNKHLDAAMRARDDKGMLISDESLRKTLRKTDEWSNVPKNKDAIMGAGRSILTKMGF